MAKELILWSACGLVAMTSAPTLKVVSSILARCLCFSFLSFFVVLRASSWLSSLLTQDLAEHSFQISCRAPDWLRMSFAGVPLQFEPVELHVVDALGQQDIPKGRR